MRTLLCILAAALLAMPLCGHVTKTTRPLRRPVAAKALDDTVTALQYDTLLPTREQVVVKGYDKPRRSTRETMFVTNATDRRIHAVALTLDYTDMDGRQLHRRHLRHNIDIPPGETRQLNVRTWDVQNAFYYYRTAAGRGRSAATPYRVTCHVDTLYLIP